MDQQTSLVTRVVAAGVGIYGLASDNMPVVAGAVFVGIVTFLIGWGSNRGQSLSEANLDKMDDLSEEEFERQLREYEEGRRDTLPGQ